MRFSALVLGPCLSILAGSAALAQSCDQMDADFAARFGSRAPSTACEITLLQIEAMTYMKGAQRACFSGSELAALLAETERAIAQSRQSYSEQGCGVAPSFPEAAYGGAPSGPDPSAEAAPDSAAEPVPEAAPEPAPEPVPQGEEGNLPFDYGSMSPEEIVEMGVEVCGDGLSPSFCNEIIHNLPSLASYLQLLTRARPEVSRQQALDAASGFCRLKPSPDCGDPERQVEALLGPAAAPAVEGPQNVVSTAEFEAWSVNRFPGFELHVLNHTDAVLKCRLTVFSTLQQVVNGQIKQTGQKDRPLLIIGPGSEAVWGYEQSIAKEGSPTSDWQVILNRYAIGCK